MSNHPLILELYISSNNTFDPVSTPRKKIPSTSHPSPDLELNDGPPAYKSRVWSPKVGRRTRCPTNGFMPQFKVYKINWGFNPNSTPMPSNMQHQKCSTYKQVHTMYHRMVLCLAQFTIIWDWVSLETSPQSTIKACGNTRIDSRVVHHDSWIEINSIRSINNPLRPLACQIGRWVLNRPIGISRSVPTVRNQISTLNK
jgi:hypothetical protein